MRDPITEVSGIDAIVFDLDGTLVDTLADIAAAMNRSLEALGLPPHAPERYRELIGEGVSKLVRAAAPDAPDASARWPALEAAFRARYGEALVVESRPYPGVPELLDALAARGVPVAILSNKPDPMTRRVVAEVLPRWRFGAVLGQRPDHPRKPDPAGALEVASALGVPPGRCAMVGDTAIDMQTAAAAGMRPIGVAWGFRPSELAAAGAELTVEHPGALVTWFERCNALR